MRIHTLQLVADRIKIAKDMLGMMSERGVTGDHRCLEQLAKEARFELDKAMDLIDKYFNNGG